MDLFDVLNLIGGLCLFLFGMNVMGQALERRAGNRLRDLLGKLTTNKLAGLLTGLGVTAIIQSSSATTVMVVGFVNSGLMTLKQAINVIMGANIGTTVTAWILSLAGIDSGNLFVSLLKPSSFTPVLALVGIVFYMFSKNSRRQDTGLILLGFATLMYGMESMSSAVSGLREVPQFRQMMIAFQNPVLGVLAGAVLTAIIQSSSASVGILQALASTGQVSLGAAIPIIMGQNIGTCVTAMLSSVGTNKNARRAALVHLSFNVIGTAVWLVVFCLVRALVRPVLLDASASLFSIAVVHSAFNVLCTLLLLPMTGLLERLAHRLVPDGRTPDTVTEIDERLLATPPLALERCRVVAAEMAETSVAALKSSLACLLYYTPALAEEVREKEDKSDHYEDVLSSYLVKLSSRKISESDSAEAAKLLKVIGDFERISDHAVNLVESAEEIKAKELEFTQAAKRELSVIISAVSEVLDLTQEAFEKDDAALALRVEPLEQVIDDLKETLRTGHILRLQQGECSSVAGFVWSDILTNLERTSDHCSNVAGCIIDMSHHELHLHESQREFRNTSEDYRQNYLSYRNKYALS